MFKERVKTHHSAMAEAKNFARGPRVVKRFLSEVEPDEKIKNQATIYIHIPFCSKICSFCNMRRSIGKPRDNYHKILIEEIKQYSQLSYVKQLTFEAVYFGGGTPTTLKTEDLREVLKALKEYFNLSKQVEITIETTVTELTTDKLEMFKKEGVNRFSVGVQTFNNEGRRLMGRVGYGNEAFEKLKEVKSFGFSTVSMDLIYNYPGQTLEMLKQDLDKIAELKLEGFSMYSLIDMKETRIEDAQNEVNDRTSFDVIAKTMKGYGYHFLELTKMVTDDRYKYVMNRHKGADTLPLGAGAGGTLGGLMLMNGIQLDDYEKSVQEFEARKGMLFSSGYREVILFKGAIQSGYLPLDESVYTDKKEYMRCINNLLDFKYIEKENDRYKLTEAGIFWGNNISRTLYELRSR